MTNISIHIKLINVWDEILFSDFCQKLPQSEVYPTKTWGKSRESFSVWEKKIFSLQANIWEAALVYMLNVSYNKILAFKGSGNGGKWCKSCRVLKFISQKVNFSSCLANCCSFCRHNILSLQSLKTKGKWRNQVILRTLCMNSSKFCVYAYENWKSFSQDHFTFHLCHSSNVYLGMLRWNFALS